MSKKHSGLRRQAVQITAQLPDETADALTVLDHARNLVVGFLDEPEPMADADNVTVFSALAKAR